MKQEHEWPFEGTIGGKITCSIHQETREPLGTCNQCFERWSRYLIAEIYGQTFELKMKMDYFFQSKSMVDQGKNVLFACLNTIRTECVDVRIIDEIDAKQIDDT